MGVEGQGGWVGQGGHAWRVGREERAGGHGMQGRG